MKALFVPPGLLSSAPVGDASVSCLLGLTLWGPMGRHHARGVLEMTSVLIQLVKIH